MNVGSDSISYRWLFWIIPVSILSHKFAFNISIQWFCRELCTYQINETSSKQIKWESNKIEKRKA